MIRKHLFLFTAMLLSTLWFSSRSVHACGGLFCQNSPVDQNAERIIFTQNRDGTITAIIQIQYTGFAEDFSWIVPLPNAITADALEVPDTAMTAFIELETSTNPRFIPPPLPRCAQDFDFSFGFGGDAMEMAMPTAGSVQIFASGEVGPFGFDVIGSEDPNALINWLRDNNYRVEPPMEPLINVYVEEQFVFLAMKLLPNQGVQDIQPIQVTYPSERPMIPLRLTAVAANPDMAVITWFFADSQAIPTNYAHMEILDHELTFFSFGGNDYRQLLGQRANEYAGRAFITEYAQPSHQMTFSDPLLQELNQRFAYLTRLNTVISPEEMTVDPVFDYDPQRRDVSNVHDLSQAVGLYDCERENGVRIRNVSSLENLPTTAVSEPEGNNFTTGVLVGVGGVVVLAGLLGLGMAIGRRSSR
jgi:hypothetical protein